MGFASSATGAACSLAHLPPLPALAPGARLFRRAQRCCQQPHPAGSPPGPCSGPPALPHVPTGHARSLSPPALGVGKSSRDHVWPQRGGADRGGHLVPAPAGGQRELGVLPASCARVWGVQECARKDHGGCTQCEVPVLPEHAHPHRVRTGTSVTARCVRQRVPPAQHPAAAGGLSCEQVAWVQPRVVPGASPSSGGPKP